MGKGTDKLYITHSEWSSEDAFGASAGANVRKSNVDGAAFKRLPFNFCSISLQPFEHPVCTKDGTIFDLTNILPWIKKHGTNPVNGDPLKSSELIKLNFTKNERGDYVDPVTYKVITDNTHLVAIRGTGNVFSYDTVDRLNVKAKNWKDLVNDAEFTRADLITLQDPQNLESRDLSEFKYLRDGTSTITVAQEQARSAGVNDENLGSAAKILKAKEAVAKARAEREKAVQTASRDHTSAGNVTQGSHARGDQRVRGSKQVPYNAAQYTSGQAAAAFTSTGLTPTTSTERAVLSDEEYMLRPKRIKQKGYARVTTSLGAMNVELDPEFAPRAVYNFIKLSEQGYYNGVSFHRNIRNFMIQGGDPTGTGRGGQSYWGKAFADEFEGPRTHDGRGVISMANKGKDTNTSQFFILYRAAKHLDRKHTVFGRVVDGMDVLDRLEKLPIDDKSRPLEDCIIEDVNIYVDPFADYLKQRNEEEVQNARKEALRLAGEAENEQTTWTGKRVRTGADKLNAAHASTVGRYLKTSLTGQTNGQECVEDAEDLVSSYPNKIARKQGGFGDFSGW